MPDDTPNLTTMFLDAFTEAIREEQYGYQPNDHPLTATESAKMLRRILERVKGKMGMGPPKNEVQTKAEDLLVFREFWEKYKHPEVPPDVVDVLLYTDETVAAIEVVFQNGTRRRIGLPADKVNNWVNQINDWRFPPDKSTQSEHPDA